jgi:hypothetical protein
MNLEGFKHFTWQAFANRSVNNTLTFWFKTLKVPAYIFAGLNFYQI